MLASIILAMATICYDDNIVKISAGVITEANPSYIIKKQCMRDFR